MAAAREEREEETTPTSVARTADRRRRETCFLLSDGNQHRGAKIRAQGQPKSGRCDPVASSCPLFSHTRAHLAGFSSTHGMKERATRAVVSEREKSSMGEEAAKRQQHPR
uniref:Uncharacterized protein n=1 Tax=Oryza glumipatula TaxID=40148 RepID=A0A0E0BP37_9ORYZ